MRDPNKEKTGFFQSLKNKIAKPKIAEDILLIHEKQMVDLRFLAKMASVIDNDKFCNQEFLIYVKVNYCLQQEIQGYEGLYKPAQLVQVAIEAKDSFLKIAETELRFRGSKQQELYEFIREQLIYVKETTDFSDRFRCTLADKTEEIMPLVKTEEGKIALEAYIKEVGMIANYELGLKLLFLFKNNKFNYFVMLKKISEMAGSMKKANLVNRKVLSALVIGEFETFQNLGHIVGIPKNKDNVDGYAIIFQYITLKHRYRIVEGKFAQLMEVMKQWYKPYKKASNIRKEFSSGEYQMPKEFSEPIPGVDIYQKYVDFLTDKKTSQAYIDFR